MDVMYCVRLSNGKPLIYDGDDFDLSHPEGEAAAAGGQDLEGGSRRYINHGPCCACPREATDTGCWLVFELDI